MSLNSNAKYEFNPLVGENGTVNLNAEDYMVNGQFRADKFYHAAWHEGTHYNMLNSAFANRAISAPGATSETWWKNLNPQSTNAHKGAQELLVNQKATSNPYYKYWGEDTHTFVTQNLRKAEQGNLNMVNEYQSWGY